MIICRRKAALRHWRWQRVSAVILIPVSIWALIMFSDIIYADYNIAYELISRPLNGIFLGLSLILCFFHGYVGLAVIMEDYVAAPWQRRITLLSMILISVIGLVVGVIILKIIFMG